MKVTRFEDLECWQEARSFVRTVYAATRDGAFKKDLRIAPSLTLPPRRGRGTGGGLSKQCDEMYTQASKTAMIVSGLLKYLRATPTKTAEDLAAIRRTTDAQACRVPGGYGSGVIH